MRKKEEETNEKSINMQKKDKRALRKRPVNFQFSFGHIYMHVYSYLACINVRAVS